MKMWEGNCLKNDKFVSLLHQNVTAQLECNCKDGKVNINIYHDLGEVEKVSQSLSEANPIKIQNTVKFW